MDTDPIDLRTEGRPIAVCREALVLNEFPARQQRADDDYGSIEDGAVEGAVGPKRHPGDLADCTAVA
jgi:hypothetical protein